MMDTTTRPEQTFFRDPVLDRVLAMLTAVSAEVWVLRERQQRLEWALENAGITSERALRSFEPTAEQNAALARDRDAFTAGLFENLLGRQMSKGAV
ncbi:MAG: hypothetical protein AB7G13_28985 [Lautropia sp.]